MHLNIEFATLTEVIKVGTPENIQDKLGMLTVELEDIAAHATAQELEIDQLEDKLYHAHELLRQIVSALDAEKERQSLHNALTANEGYQSLHGVISAAIENSYVEL